MKEDNKKETSYKLKRDEWRANGNKFLVTYYQILIVQEAEESKFSLYKKSNLKQHWDILSNLLGEILGTDDADYQRGIYNEVIIAGKGIRLFGKEEECQICRSFFEESGNLEYVHGAYQLHVSSILEIAHDNAEAAQIYADNLLMLLKLRYGINSWQYAKMKLYIIGEYYYQYKKEDFLYEFKKNYDYLKEYTAECDSFFCQTLALYAYLLEENADKDYGMWLERCEEAVEQKTEDKLYCVFKCEIAWIKARVLDKQKQDMAALSLLQETITKYLEQDCENKTPFYGCVYLMTANICHKLQDFDQMAYYAQKGLAVCESLNQKGSELYYNLYSYIGILYMTQHRWGEAEKLYAGCVQDILRKYGKENENYIIYMSHLAVSALNQNKNAYSYFRELKSIKDEKLRKKTRALFNNELNYSIARGDSIGVIKNIYEQCIDNMKEEEDKAERVRLDTLYLSAIVNADEFVEKANSLLDDLEESYKNNFTDELAKVYWNSRLLWEWNKGNLQTALEISERIFQEMGQEEYEKNRHIVINYIQLLIINEQYHTAKKIILSMMKLVNDRILSIGYGNIFSYVLIFRFLISMYIQIFKREGNHSRPNEREAKLLLEKIMYCKTIEREMKSFLGKDEDDDQMNLYYFKQAHRKLAALELGLKIGKLEQSEYERKRMKCIQEMAEYEANLNQRTPFHKIHEYKFEAIEVPHNTVCIEYFAYYNFQSDAPMLRTVYNEGESEIYSYLAVVLCEDKGQIKILDIIDIPLEGMLEVEAGHLLDAARDTSKYDEKVIKETIRHFRQLFAVPVLKYFTGKEKIYLGLDYLQQMLPVDLIFCDHNGEPIDIILVDSLCYVEKDTKVCIEGSDALVIGNPQLNMHGEQKELSLPCGEIECIKIAEMFKTKAYVGREARQKVLWGKEAKDVIHISTHGVWEDMGDNVLFEDNLFIDSFLKFAGFEDWKVGKRDKECGNGIVSGDDFLFMDLTKTKLVVLSACVSGLGYTRGLSTIHGMRWAIGAAGAENSITTLWEVSDDASSILMIFFYRNLRTMPIGEALYEAKKQLRTITVGELKNDSILKQIVEIAQKRNAEQYAANNDVPYAHWKYWAGFVCYHR